MTKLGETTCNDDKFNWSCAIEAPSKLSPPILFTDAGSVKTCFHENEKVKLAIMLALKQLPLNSVMVLADCKNDSLRNILVYSLPESLMGNSGALLFATVIVPTLVEPSQFVSL